MSLRDEFKEKIARDLYVIWQEATVGRRTFKHRKPRNESWEDAHLSKRIRWFNHAEDFLTLEHEGHRLLIGKVGGELPENPHRGRLSVKDSPDAYGWWTGFNEGQQSLLKEGWFKEVKGEAV